MIGQCLASITLGICIGDECTGSTEFAVIRTLVDQTTKTGSKHFRVDALEYFDINTVSFGLFHDLMLCLTFCSVQEFRLQMHLIFISISALNIIMSLVAVFRLAPTRPRSIMFYVLFNFLFILGDIGLGVFSSLNLSEVLNQNSTLLESLDEYEEQSTILRTIIKLNAYLQIHYLSIFMLFIAASITRLVIIPTTLLIMITADGSCTITTTDCTTAAGSIAQHSDDVPILKAQPEVVINRNKRLSMLPKPPPRTSLAMSTVAAPNPSYPHSSIEMGPLNISADRSGRRRRSSLSLTSSMLEGHGHTKRSDSAISISRLSRSRRYPSMPSLPNSETADSEMMYLVHSGKQNSEGRFQTATSAPMSAKKSKKMLISPNKRLMLQKHLKTKRVHGKDWINKRKM